ncbi:exodeoxyribonuclease III [Candidatus Mancarchaeum acidiphilum]|uniref:Exodeoxyribonuclease III n=1 Tax=Candidatus Mancarchaeum acidiphilum TaxID=1920749 RepID=A0A218NNQ0_9ARCH|nr:exodeoxyribonuclease III [Candidatus Mancarchaeum acidiphilum]ASI14107.1 exodeoxyribonuclease III [Candidatus Mancarchaeum acidiphilum]
MELKIISWNVNGIRSATAKGLTDFIKNEDADILCFQEIKAGESDIPQALRSEGYELFVNPAEKKGYSGTMVMSRIKPLKFQKGIGESRDAEGRVEVLEFEKFYLLNIYFPNSKPMLERLDYKIQFDHELLNYLNDLKKRKGVVACGDFNVAHKDIDIAQPQNNINHAGFTKEEREWMDEVISSGYIDTFRYINGNKIKYSWWSNFASARQRNIGWRIDYFITDTSLKENIKSAEILDQVKGSDHAPVKLTLSL